MTPPRRITVVEVGPRDGLQNEDTLVSTADKIEFVNLHLPNPRKVPIGPNAVIVDDIGFNMRT